MVVYQNQHKAFVSERSISFIICSVGPICSLKTRGNMFQHISLSTEKNPSWESDSPSFGQETGCLLRKAMVHYRVQSSLPLNSVVSQVNGVNTLLIFHFNIIIELSTLILSQVDSSQRVFRRKCSIYFSFLLCVLHVLIILCSMIWTP
jgi:hypothetical protein